MTATFDIVAIQAALHEWVVVGSGLPEDHVTWEGQNAPRPTHPAISMKLKGFTSPGQDWVDVAENPLVLTPLTIASVSGNVLAFAAPHGLALGDGPVRLTTTGTLPAGLAVATDYWFAYVDATHLSLSTTFLRARSHTVITLSSSGTGTNRVISTADTRRAGAEIMYTARGPRTATLTLECYAKDGVGLQMAVNILVRVIGSRALPSQRDRLSAANVAMLQTQAIRAIHGGVNAAIFEPRARVDINLSLASEVSETGTYIERADVTPDYDGVDKATVRIPTGDH